MRTSDILVTPATAPDSLNRAAVFMSVSELNFLVSFLKDTSADKPGSRVPSDIFRNLVTNLPLVEPPRKRDSEISSSVSMSTLSTSASKTNLKAVLTKSFDAGNFFQSESDGHDSSLGSTGSSANHNGNAKNTLLDLSLQRTTLIFSEIQKRTQVAGTCIHAGNN